MEILLILLGIFLFLLGPAATGFYSLYEYHDQTKNHGSGPRPLFFYFMGFLSEIPLIVYLLILISNHQHILPLLEKVVS